MAVGRRWPALGTSLIRQPTGTLAHPCRICASAPTLQAGGLLKHFDVSTYCDGELGALGSIVTGLLLGNATFRDPASLAQSPGGLGVCVPPLGHPWITPKRQGGAALHFY